MAVERWELEEREAHPQLQLVEAAPTGPGGKPLLASLFVIFVALAIGLPSIASALQGEPEPQRWVARPQPAVALMSLDPIQALPKSGRPESNEPFAGLLFVRCTRLWSAWPDGSHARKVLEVPGISSPAISPNARTIAFFVDSESGQELWTAAADGTQARRVGGLTSAGTPPLSRATALAWSPNGDSLAFALVDGRYGEFEGGSAIWALDLESGRFSKRGAGWPAPFWSERHAAFTMMDGERGWAKFESPTNYRDWLVKSSRTSKHDLAAALVPNGYSYNTEYGAAIYREAGNKPRLIVKDLYSQKKRLVAKPPPGYAFAEHARPSIVQDGSSVAIDLVDGAAERDLGILDTRSGNWTVLDYAWEAVASPAPVVTGPLGARRAIQVAGDLLGGWNGARRNLVVEPSDRGAFPFESRGLGYTLGDPVRSEKGWSVPATVYGPIDGEQSWRSALLTVRSKGSRMVVDVEPVTDMTTIETVDDAVAFAEAALGRPIVAPLLPSDADLMRDTLYAWTYNGSTQVSFEAKTVARTRAGAKEQTWGFGYGDDLDLSLGCGESGDPQEIDLGGVPALEASLSNLDMVIWPATVEQSHATNSVHGYNVPKEQVVGVARRMAAQTP